MKLCMDGQMMCHLALGVKSGMVVAWTKIVPMPMYKFYESQRAS